MQIEVLGVISYHAHIIMGAICLIECQFIFPELGSGRHRSFLIVLMSLLILLLMFVPLACPLVTLYAHKRRVLNLLHHQ